MNTFPRRILLFTIQCLLSKTCTESEYFPSVFEQEINLEAVYIMEEQASNFVPHPLSARDWSIDKLMDLNIHLNFLRDIQLCLWDGHIFCMFFAMFLVAWEYHTASHLK